MGFCMENVKENYTPLRFCVNISKRLNWFLIVLHVWALLACVFNDLNVVLQVVLASLVVLHFFYIKPVKEIVLSHTDAGWQMVAARELVDIVILPSTVISSFAVFLHFKQDERFKTLLIMNDALSMEDYRLLIVRLKTSLDYQV